MISIDGWHNLIVSVRDKVTQARIERDNIDDCNSPEWWAAHKVYKDLCREADGNLWAIAEDCAIASRK